VHNRFNQDNKLKYFKEEQFMKKLFTWRIGTVGLLLLLLLLSVSPAMAQDPVDMEPVLMEPPAPDAAFVAELEGIQDVVAESFVRRLKLSEGIVIRQSYVEDGKIIIPPSGLYYTTRTPLSKALQGDKVLFLGELYNFVEYGTRFDVIKDVDYDLGHCELIGDGSKCFQLTGISYSFAGDIPRATFQILKPSGNYYGASFPTTASELVASDCSIVDGTENPAGSLPPGEPTDWQNTYYGLPVASSGQTYVVVDEITDMGAHLVDAGTGAVNWMWLSEGEPAEMALGAGESAELGDYMVQVAEVDTEAGTAQIQIMDSNEEVVAEKTFGPLDEALFNYLPEDPLAREKLTLSYEDDVFVHWDVFREPFQDDKVALVGYSDMIRLENPADLWLDDRFIVRPDT
jgi:hypothetical protein